MITRRTALTTIAALLAPVAVRAASGEEFSVASGPDSLPVSRYAAAAAGKRPAVIALHGSRGIELRPRAYERYAEALAARGIDAYFLRYMTPADTAALTPKSSTHESRDAYYTARYDGWADTVSAAMTAILNRPDSSGRIGLLGFSLGGYIAADAAARDNRIAALAVLYGGMPKAMIAKIKHLPPLIVLHGEEDRNVPIAEGHRLVELGKSASAEAEFVPYPGKAHGFDFSDTDPATPDAIDRVTRFFQRKLTT
ncbi:carboxymethylenebutenolidase [Bradyrhizobium sp. JR1.5]|uniref:dienelactone hydrolase family protein n=1 Tax=unclassified Bradyrhizobium TaxID=2631580 RepID=UPI0033964524